MLPKMLDMATLQAGYARGAFTPLDVVAAVFERIEASPDKSVWISRRSEKAVLAEAKALMDAGPAGSALSLWAVPFAVKDNIDVAGLPTTAACPAFAYDPVEDATVVTRLRAAGAILIGKTNLDQFATGLNGTRSPYGAPRCVFDRNYISGGSSSGSAVAVAAGQVAFALGTDTAGSGRVPAAFNNIVGVKPTRGTLSSKGVVPACRSLDCVSILACTVGDAERVRQAAEVFDGVDPYSRRMMHRAIPDTGLRFGVLSERDREFFGDCEVEALYEAAVVRLEELGGRAVAIDYAPFRECAALLYGGPWVAERLAAVENFVAQHEDAMDPTVRGILVGARKMTAVDSFRGAYTLEALRRKTDYEWDKMDVLLLPTAPTIYTVEALLADPVTLNSRLGNYTNFVNLLDCSAIAIPAGFRKDGLPAGVSLIAPAFADHALAELADRLHRIAPCGMGLDRSAPLPVSSRISPTNDGLIPLAVVGAHLSGMPLNFELVAAGGRLLRTCRTAPDYRLFTLPGSVPPRPGLLRDPGFEGAGIEVEVWGLPPASFGSFVAEIPAPLCIGKVALADGTVASGFLCEAHSVVGAREITMLGWRAFTQTS